MTSEIIYNGNLRTTARHLQSGEAIITDAPVDNQGKGEAFSPTDLVATALGSCMMTIMGIKARDAGIDIEGTKAAVNKIMAANPRRIAKVEVTFTMPGKNYSEDEKMMLREAALNCPVCKSLSAECEAAVEFVW
ncbi:MAG: OsmC family protein [Bacteroidota bacterium]